MFTVSIASPPDREGLVAEILVYHDGVVDQPAEVFLKQGQLMIAIFPDGGGPPTDYPLGEFLAAIGQGISRLGS